MLGIVAMPNDDDSGALAVPLGAVGPTHGHPTGDAAELARGHGDPRAAVRENDIVCLLCGAAFRQLTNTHLLAHGLTSVEYKRRFGYNLGRPLMCHALRRFYAERAREVGLAGQIRERPILANRELSRRGGTRPSAVEEILTRREVQRLPRRRWSVRDPRGQFVAGSDGTRRMTGRT
jgi:predicted transcriptional regulator